MPDKLWICNSCHLDSDASEGKPEECENCGEKEFTLYTKEVTST